jgi:hypothetical protein
MLGVAGRQEEGLVKKYVVELRSEERAELLELPRKGECKARKLKCSK